MTAALKPTQSDEIAAERTRRADARRALADAIEQLEGWIDWKCPAKHRAEHEANVERLRAVLASQSEPQVGMQGMDETYEDFLVRRPEEAGPELLAQLQSAVDHIALLTDTLDTLVKLGATVAICGATYRDSDARAAIKKATGAA